MARASDPRTTTRWSAENYAWLKQVADANYGGQIGTVVQGLVSAARLGDEERRIAADLERAAGISSVPVSAPSTQVNGGEGARLCDVCVGRVEGGLEPECGEVGGCGRDRARSAAAAGSVPGGAAPVPRPGAAPARRFRLDVAVARQLEPGGGPIAPVTRARALRLIKDGKVEVSGVAAGTVLDPSMHVGAGEVVVRQ